MVFWGPVSGGASLDIPEDGLTTRQVQSAAADVIDSEGESLSCPGGGEPSYRAGTRRAGGHCWDTPGAACRNVDANQVNPIWLLNPNVIILVVPCRFFREIAARGEVNNIITDVWIGVCEKSGLFRASGDRPCYAGRAQDTPTPDDVRVRVT